MNGELEHSVGFLVENRKEDVKNRKFYVWIDAR